MSAQCTHIRRARLRWSAPQASKSGPSSFRLALKACNRIVNAVDGALYICRNGSGVSHPNIVCLAFSVKAIVNTKVMPEFILICTVIAIQQAIATEMAGHYKRSLSDGEYAVTSRERFRKPSLAYIVGLTPYTYLTSPSVGPLGLQCLL